MSSGLPRQRWKHRGYIEQNRRRRVTLAPRPCSSARFSSSSASAVGRPGRSLRTSWRPRGETRSLLSCGRQVIYMDSVETDRTSARCPGRGHASATARVGKAHLSSFRLQRSSVCTRDELPVSRPRTLRTRDALLNAQGGQGARIAVENEMRSRCASIAAPGRDFPKCDRAVGIVAPANRLGDDVSMRAGCRCAKVRRRRWPSP